MTSHSSGSGRIDYYLIERPERVCEMCKEPFLPVIDEPVCGECVRKLFESDSDEEIAPHDPDEGVDYEWDSAIVFDEKGEQYDSFGKKQ